MKLRAPLPSTRRLRESLDQQIEQLREELASERAQRETELAQAQEIEASRERYADLYDFAPVGYVSLSHSGCICDINLTGASLFGCERQRLLGLPLTPRFLKADRRRWLNHLRAARATTHDAVELALAPGRVPSKVLRFHTVRAPRAGAKSHRSPELRSAILDVSSQRQTEELLHQSERQYRLLFEANPNPMWVFDEETLQFLAVNPAAVRHYGWSREEFLSMNVRDIRPPEQVDKVLEAIKRQGGSNATAAGLWRHRTKNGALIDVELTISSILFAGRPGRLVLANDVTERARAEGRMIADLDAMTRLKEVGELFLREGNLEKVLTDIVISAMAMTQADFGHVQLLDTKTLDLKIAAQHGFPKWWLNFWDGLSRRHECCGAVLERGKRVIVEDVERSPIFIRTPALEIQLRAGVRAFQSTPLITRSGRPVGILSTHYKQPHRPAARSMRLLDLLARQTADIIDRAEAEVVLREREEQLRRSVDFDEAVLKNLGEAVYTVDRQGLLSFLNPAAEKLFGWTMAEILGQKMHDLAHHHHRDGRSFPASDCAILQALKSGEPLEHHEDVFIRKDGTFFDVSYTVAPLRDANSEIAGLVVMFTDITAPKLAERRQRANLAVTSILANAPRVEAANVEVLQAIGETLGWELGAKWDLTTDGGKLQCSNIWSSLAVPAESFKVETSAAKFRRGSSLPGRVWRSLKPAWILDVESDRNFKRRSAVRDAGLRSAFAFPITSGEQFLGAMEFFSRDLREPDADLLAMAASIGAQLGQFTVRKQAEAALRESQERLAGVVSSAMDSIISVDEEQRIVLFNETAEKMFGYPASEALGQPLVRFIAERFREEHEQHVWHFAETGVTARQMGALGEISGLRANGEEFPIEASISQLNAAGGKLFTVVLRDISARKQAEALMLQMNSELERRVAERTGELAQANQMLRMLSECNEALVRIPDEPELTGEICRIIREVGDYSMAWVGFAEGKKPKTVRLVASSGCESDDLNKSKIDSAGIWSGGGPTGTALRTGKICVEEDFLAEPELKPLREAALECGFRSCVALPLKAEKNTFGALTIYSPQARAFDPARINLLSDLATNLSLSIVARRLRQERDQTRRRLEQRTGELRALAVEISRVEHRERRRIAHILHEQLQQLLVGARYQVNSLLCSSQPEDNASVTRRLDDLLAECLETSRSLTAELSPPILHEAGLTPALKWLARWFHQTHGLDVELVGGEAPGHEKEELRITLFQAVRELLFNVVKHGRVNQARVRLNYRPDNWVEVVVSDSGAGFDPEALQTRTDTQGGFGLFSLRERLDWLGGRIEISSAPGKGTKLTLLAPLAEPGLPVPATHSVAKV